jgi:transcriptional regulator GlxA family with amidase domain
MQPRSVVFVAFDGVQSLDLCGPFEVFAASGAITQRAGEPAPYTLTVAAPRAGPLASSSGLGLHAQISLAELRAPIDTLVVAGGEGARRSAQQADMVDEVRRLASLSRRVTSVCTGAYLLAAAGCLTGRRATTHWAWCDDLGRRYPTLTVEPDAIFVRDGEVSTSAGVTAGMDLALALVEEDLGREVALQAARWLVMFVRRPGGQSQFSAQLRAQFAERGPIRELQSWILEHTGDDLRVESLARRAGMSPRNFARVFRREVGLTPACFVEEVRVEVARRLLETTRLDVSSVAQASGFGSDRTLRQAFVRRVGATPTDRAADEGLDTCVVAARSAGAERIGSTSTRWCYLRGSNLASVASLAGRPGSNVPSKRPVRIIAPATSGADSQLCDRRDDYRARFSAQESPWTS